MSQTPSLGRIVIVRTPMPIAGQPECAAIVTGVVSDDQVHVTVFPPAGGPFPLERVYRAGHPYVASYAWRWPERA